MRAKDVLGRRGEELAADFLEDRRIRVIDRNWRCPAGELDVVAVDGATLVIAEVKTRRNTRYGHPFEAVTPAKLARLHTLAVLWQRDRNEFWTSVRIDVLSVLDDGKAEPVIEHLRGVV